MHEYPTFVKHYILDVGKCPCRMGEEQYFNGSGDVFTRPLKLIRKLSFGCFTNLKEKQFEKLARGLFDHTIMLRECLAKGGERPNLKSIYKITRVLKQKSVICNEIMFHFRFLKLTSNNQKPYKDDKWKEVKTKRNLDKMIFSILGLDSIRRLQ